MAGLREWQERLVQRQGQRQMLETQRTRHRTTLRRLRGEARDAEKALAVVRTVAQLTQEQLQYKLSDLVSLCLDAVFAKPYRLQVDFVQRRNKTEADVTFVKNGKTASRTGFGVRDVAANLGLRVALWSIAQPRSRNVLVLDEPFRNLKDPTQQMQARARDLMKEISKDIVDPYTKKVIGLQFLIVEHDPAISTGADRTFGLTKERNVTRVE